MNGVEKISSKESDADLLVKNMTTNGVTGGTAAQTIGMEYTGNKDTNWAEADMTVYYDQDYLVRNTVDSNSIYYFTQDRLATQSDNKVFGENTAVDGIKFTIGEGSSAKEVTVKIDQVKLDAFLANVPANNTTAYQQFADLINEALVKLNAEGNDVVNKGDLDGYTITLDQNYFRTNGGHDNQGDQLKYPAYAIVLTAPDGETISKPAMNQTEKFLSTYDMFNDTDTENRTEFSPVKINVDLEKVGLAADGGALVIGSMNKNANNVFGEKQGITTTDTVAGFDEFNVHVDGNKTKNSSLSKLISTDNTLRKVSIDSKDGSTANLTIGNSNTGVTFGTSAANASAFKDVQVMDANKVGKVFAGDLKLYAGITAEIAAKYFDNTDVELYGLNNAEELATFNYDGGSGNDTLNIAIDANAIAYSFGQGIAGAAATDVTKTVNANAAKEIAANKFEMNINGNAGNDTINISMDVLSATSSLGAMNAYTLGATGIVINGGAGNDTINLTADTAAPDQWSFTVAFSGTNFGHDIIDNFTLGGVVTNVKQLTNEVQELDLRGFVAHKDEVIKVSVGDKVYEVKATADMTNAEVITAVTDILEATTISTLAVNNKNTTEDYFTVTTTTVTGIMALDGNTTTGAGLNGYVGKDVGTVKVEITTGSETNVNYEKIPPLHTTTADTVQQGGQLWYGATTVGNGADFLDFTAYTAKGVVMVDSDGNSSKIIATGSTTAIGDKLVFLVESIHEAGVYNAYTATVQTAGQTDFSVTTGVNALQNKVLLGSIDLGSDVNTGAPANDIHADQFLF
ncbi:hypothetical protein [Aliarcobacter cryaerophilus]|uniref:Uncharacterized protein n=1 Tax=Aliarcobacter cryaerophilus TaxID=28198 RepID=A0A2S9SPY1_9BACT|nr:hypothetical protein [Aliarcobacter cryaerophilus]PRM88640.1 hypothetical protein CJ669_03140 [Aliarcobacter cryaerophilus]